MRKGYCCRKEDIVQMALPRSNSEVAVDLRWTYRNVLSSSRVCSAKEELLRK